MCVYLPSDYLLFKMMKACIGVSEPEDLWIYKSAQSYDSLCDSTPPGEKPRNGLAKTTRVGS